MSEITAWLENLGLGKYVEVFAENDIDVDILADLTEEHLKELGISLGHRVKLLKAISALSAQQRQDSQSTETSAVPDSPLSSTAERRQLTVMFVDLVGSTALSSMLDPEDLRELILAYQNAVSGEINRIEGHVAKFMGDGVLAYFGWPRAHEEEAERAVRAGLSITAAVAQLQTPDGEPLATRIGIATGLVVIGDLIGEGSAQEEAVVGETPNIAARLQTLAEPGRVVIAERTRQLLGEVFELQSLGLQRLKGITTPVEVFTVGDEQRVESRFQARRSGHLLPLVGREQELALLSERWRRARSGEGQCLLLSGEAGVGKSRITQALVDTLAGEVHTRLRYQCSPYHSDSALYPVIQQLSRAADFVADDNNDARLDKLEAVLCQGVAEVTTAAALLAALLDIDGEDRYGALELTPQQQRACTLDVLIEQLLGLARRQPVLFVVEDMHWIDPSTLKLVQLTLEHIGTARVLMLLTARSDFQSDLGDHPHLTPLTLTRLGREYSAALVAGLTQGKPLPEPVLAEITAKTDGIPLFVEELTKTVLESGLLRETDEAFVLDGPLPPLAAIPASLHDSLLARLDRLSSVKEIAQTAACIGREFSYQLLTAVVPVPEPQLQAGLDVLVEAGLVYRRGHPPNTQYLFKHALVRDAAYESLLRGKRQQLHADIAQLLEKQFPDIVTTQPEMLAYHFTEAGLIEQAVSYWHRAAQRASVRSADMETIAHITRGLELVAALPDTSHQAKHELNLRLTLGPALMNTKGSAAQEVEQTYLRARELCEQLHQAKQHFTALWGLWLNHDMSGRLDSAQQIADELIDVAEGLSDSTFLLQGYHCAWSTEMDVGQFTQALEHAEYGIALYDIDRHRNSAYLYGGHDAGVCGYACAVLSDWLLGYPNRALQRAQETLALAETVAHPFSLAQARFYVAMLHQLRADPKAVKTHAEALIEYSIAHDLVVWLLNGRLLQSWALASLGQVEHGVTAFCQALDERRAMDIKSRQGYYLTILAELFAQHGPPARGIDTITEALELLRSTGECAWEAITHRIHGELLLAQRKKNEAESESCFKRSIEVAHRQQAKSLELRAATNLARLWYDQDKRREAHDLLAPVYNWFTEGFDTAGLKDAKALLDELN